MRDTVDNAPGCCTSHLYDCLQLSHMAIGGSTLIFAVDSSVDSLKRPYSSRLVLSPKLGICHDYGKVHFDQRVADAMDVVNVQTAHCTLELADTFQSEHAIFPF
jgi:hypothetical protein